jgi:hypothetical protein
MLSTTLTNNRIINGAVVKYKTEGKILTLQIECDHLIALNTYCKINITGLDVVDYVNNNDIFNGTKIFEAVSNTVLEATVVLSAVYDNINISLQVVSGTPVIITANNSWIINCNQIKEFNFKLINSNIVNFNSASIEIVATTSNGTITIGDEYNDGTGSLFSLHEKYLEFYKYQTFTLQLKNSPNSATNIPIIIEPVL